MKLNRRAFLGAVLGGLAASAWGMGGRRTEPEALTFRGARFEFGEQTSSERVYFVDRHLWWSAGRGWVRVGDV